MTEKIKHKIDNDEEWICICTNTPQDGGFLPCNEEGDQIEPKNLTPLKGLYVCVHCGRIIDSQTLEVVGQNPDFKQLS